MSDDPEFSRRDFLHGLGAAVAAGATPTDVIETVTKIVGEGLHPLATEIATNVWRLHEPYYADYPNDFQDLRSEVVQYLTDFDKDLGRDPETFGDKLRAYRDAARLLESGWTPPPRVPTVEREVELTLLPEERTPSGTAREAVRTVTLAEHVDELRAELRGSLDSRERETIAAEIEAARSALKAQEHGRDQPFPAEGVPRPDATPNRPDLDTTIAKLSAETGLPYTPAASGEFVAGIYRQSLTLASGRFAMIDDGLGFALVPWTPELDQHLGRHVAGVAQESGGIEWSLGRKRGLEI